MAEGSGARIERLSVAVYRVPTDAPESDGTLAWDATTMVTVEAAGGGATGLGYSYADAATGRFVAEQLGRWVEQGIGKVKMKVGRRPDRDARRVRLARRAIGPEAGLMVDANGAYTRKQALCQAEAFAAESATWFEEPVSSDDLPSPPPAAASRPSARGPGWGSRSSARTPRATWSSGTTGAESSRKASPACYRRRSIHEL